MAYGLNQSETDVAAMVRSALVDRISSERYDLWISSDATWSFDGQVLVIEMSTDFACQLARKMLGKDIIATAQATLGPHVDVDYRVGKKPGSSISSETANSAGAEAVGRDESANSAGAEAAADEDQPNKMESSEDAPSIVAFPTQSIGGQAESSAGATMTAEQAAKSSGVRKVPLGPAAGSSSQNASAASRQVRSAALAASRIVEPIRGTSNELAVTTATLAVNDPGRLSPAFFHGPSGCGKSVIAASIARKLRVDQRMRRVVHMTSEQFTNDFMEGLRGGGLPMFRRKYRDVQALVLDDIQFFVGKKSTLAEVKHTLDNLIKEGRQVVCTADRSLNDLEALGSDIVGRLRGGLVAPIAPLDEKLRETLLQNELAREGVELDGEVISQLANRCCGDGRVVCGIAKRLTAAASVGGGVLTWEKAWEAVFDLVQATQPVVRIVDIDRVVCSVFGLEPQSLKSSSKMRSVSQPRMLAMFLARKYTPAAYKEIGEYFGKRRHSTVISAEKTVESWLNENAGVAVARGMSIQDAIRHVESQLQVG